MLVIAWRSIEFIFSSAQNHQHQESGMKTMEQKKLTLSELLRNRRKNISAEDVKSVKMSLRKKKVTADAIHLYVPEDVLLLKRFNALLLT